MAITRFPTTTAILLFSSVAINPTLRAAIQDPFPPGFSMNTLDAVIDTKGPTGRQPWLAAAFCSDPGPFGAAFAATSYYNSVNDPDMYRATLGAWYQYHGFVAKTAFSHFSALDVYFEESGFLSIGSRHLKFCTLSAELTATRMRSPLLYACRGRAVRLGPVVLGRHFTAPRTSSAQAIPC
jgi:hypothetical protein